ncbi:hypothetical protein [Paraburkholderia pallida]|uniref:Uncharacterized protein n=1 Tax=Paraburkholderia pallida TaxID=2547399 RepID=A0A4P7D8V1_9BURK|nr:hypothetical protein [Paraburkholderia pallida]QBR03620.1 hypothetical protein E1956_41655 [Paraburkholderia pallida]
MHWHVYRIPSIDFGWGYLPTVSDMAARLGADDGRMRTSGQPDLSGDVTLDAFIDAWERAQSVASEQGWEGDLCHDPVVFWLPAENDFQFGFVFKQDNNGTTFVVSPFALPHIAALE